MRTFLDFCFALGGFIGGNFLYQYLQDYPNWLTAWERSFFQTVTGVTIYFLFRCKHGPNISDSSR